MSNKKPSAIFKDLGEIKSGKVAEYAVECTFDSLQATGIGATRIEARETASKLMLDMIRSPLGAPKKKAHPTEQKTDKEAAGKAAGKPSAPKHRLSGSKGKQKNGKKPVKK